MRSLVFSGLLLLAAHAPVAYAESQPPAPSEAAPSESISPETRLDQLFSELKQERNEAAARRIAQRIQEEWRRQGGATADLLIGWAREAAADEKFHVALDLLDQATTLYPTYAESWNNRALVYLMMDDYSRAMSDLSRTLVIEPRHFSAMSGLAGVLRATGHEERALDVYRRMLAIYPMQRSAQRAVLSLVDKQTDERL